MDKDFNSSFSKAIIQNEMKKKPHLSEFECYSEIPFMLETKL